VNKKFNIEQEMDGIFKEGLENSISQVPPGIWESVSSSIGSATTGAAVVGTAAKTAVWMKAAIVSLTVAAVASVSYIVVNKDNEKPTIPIENTVSKVEIVDNKTVESQVQLEANSSEINNNPEINNKLDVQKLENKGNNAIPHHNNGGVFRGDSISKQINWLSDYETKNIVEKSNDHDHTDVNKESDKTETEDATKDSNELKKGDFNINYTENQAVKDSSYIFCPDVFTPNGDGKNDCYEVVLVNEESFFIQIYDLNMNKLYESTNKYKKWCCELPNGGIAPAGNYLVMVKYKYRGKTEESKSFWLKVIK
jgi:gliding motility-associated-like protein